MKIRDTVRIAGGDLVAHFGLTGETNALVVLPLSGVKLVRHGVTIEATWAAGLPKVLETFSDEPAAQRAFDRVQGVVVTHARGERIRAGARGFAKYVALPFGLVLLGLAMNVAVQSRLPTAVTSLGDVPPEPTHAVRLVDQPTEPDSTEAAPALAGARAAAGQAGRVTPEMPSVAQSAIAQALKQGAESGKFAVPLGAGKGEPIYVFEDPLCTHCQALAPELEKVAKTHAVYVFPTSVVGGDDAIPLAALALCAPLNKRGATWEKALSGALAAGAPNGRLPAASPECVSAVTANNEIFARMGLAGTPTIFDAKGRMMPLTTAQTAESVIAWATGG